MEKPKRWRDHIHGVYAINLDGEIAHQAGEESELGQMLARMSAQPPDAIAAGRLALMAPRSNSRFPVAYVVRREGERLWVRYLDRSLINSGRDPWEPEEEVSLAKVDAMAGEGLAIAIWHQIGDLLPGSRIGEPDRRPLPLQDPAGLEVGEICLSVNPAGVCELVLLSAAGGVRGFRLKEQRQLLGPRRHSWSDKPSKLDPRDLVARIDPSFGRELVLVQHGLPHVNYYDSEKLKQEVLATRAAVIERLGLASDPIIVRNEADQRQLLQPVDVLPQGTVEIA